MNAVVDNTAPDFGSVTDETILRSLDFQVAVDSSGSTERESHRFPGKSRLQEMQEEVTRVASAAGRYDSDGITLHEFADGVETYDGVTMDKVDEVFAKISAGGSTNLGDVIRKVTKKAVESSKPNVAFIFTDGEASTPRDVIQAIKEAADATKGRPKLGIAIIQIGKDRAATAFLNQLDNDLAAQGIPDMIGVVTVEQAGSLNFGNLVWVAQNK